MGVKPKLYRISFVMFCHALSMVNGLDGRPLTVLKRERETYGHVMIISVSNARPSCHLQNDNFSRLAEWKGWLAGAWSDASVHKTRTGILFLPKDAQIDGEIVLLMLLSMDTAEKQKRAHQLIITRQQPCLKGSLICGRCQSTSIRNQ